MICDVVVPMTATTGDEAALAAAISLAESAKARLCAIEPVNLPMSMANAWGIAPEMAFADACSKLREQGEINAAWLRGRLERASIDWEVRIVESLAGDPSRNLAVHARYADMSVMAAATGQEESVGARVAAYFNGLLFESGRPVLVIPPRHRATFPISRAVFAWQPTREATRALHDALPLLLKAGKVDVLMVQPHENEDRHDPLAGTDIADHLARHGLQADVVKHHGPKEAVASMLLDHASECGAQLLVAGGYGHSRLREWALGGTTRELLHATNVPILFSH